MARTTHLLVVGALCGTASVASAQTLRVVFSEVAADPTSLVPAGADVPAGTLFTGFDRPYRSPDGLLWIISATSNLASTEDELIVVGSGFAGDTVVREGTAFGSPTAGENVGLIDRNMGIADGGAYAFATNTDGPTETDEYIVRFDGLIWIAAAQEGQAVPGMPTEFLGTTLDSAGILNDGVSAAYRAPSTTGMLPPESDDFLVRDPNIVAQTGLSIPADQAGGAGEAWENFDANDYYSSADGSSYLALGDLTGATTGDDVVVVNDAVVIQEDSVLGAATLSSPVESIVEALMNPGGAWFARGDNDDQQDWVVRDGAIVGLSGASIVPGSTEVYSDAIFTATFFWMADDDAGHYVIGGTTSNPDVEADAVLVLDGATVLARQGDPVDLDGNGVYDDDVFVDVFNNDDGFLTSDGVLHFTADVIDGAGGALGQAFLSLDTTGFAPCPGDMAPVPADALVGFEDLLVVLTFWGPCPMPCETSCPGDANGDCEVNFEDLLVVLALWGPCP